MAHKQGKAVPWGNRPATRRAAFVAVLLLFAGWCGTSIVEENKKRAAATTFPTITLHCAPETGDDIYEKLPYVERVEIVFNASDKDCVSQWLMRPEVAPNRYADRFWMDRNKPVTFWFKYSRGDTEPFENLGPMDKPCRGNGCDDPKDQARFPLGVRFELDGTERKISIHLK